MIKVYVEYSGVVEVSTSFENLLKLWDSPRLDKEDEIVVQFKERGIINNTYIIKDDGR